MISQNVQTASRRLDVFVGASAVYKECIHDRVSGRALGSPPCRLECCAEYLSFEPSTRPQKPCHECSLHIPNPIAFGADVSGHLLHYISSRAYSGLARSAKLPQSGEAGTSFAESWIRVSADLSQVSGFLG